MSSKIVIFLLAVLVLLSFRVYPHLQQKVTNENQLTGTITTQPYVKAEKIVFWLGASKVETSYQYLEVGDKVRLGGRYKEERYFLAKTVEKLEAGFFERTLSPIRNHLANSLSADLPQREASLLVGMVLGIKTNLEQSFKEDLLATGTLHVVVVSGFNITLVAGLALYLSPWLGRKQASILGIILICFYTLIVGPSLPTLRATFMGLIGLLAMITGRKDVAIYSLILVGSGFILINPEVIFDISFQLSFLATFGLVVLRPLLQPYFKKLPKLIAEGLSTSLAAQLLVIPIIFYHFGNVSLLSPVVNSLVIWLVPVITILGFVMIIFAVVSNSLAELISYLVYLPVWTFAEVVSFFGNFRQSLISLAPQNFLLLLGYYLVLSSVLLNRIIHVNKNKYI